MDNLKLSMCIARYFKFVTFDTYSVGNVLCLQHNPFQHSSTVTNQQGEYECIPYDKNRMLPCSKVRFTSWFRNGLKWRYYFQRHPHHHHYHTKGLIQQHLDPCNKNGVQQTEMSWLEN